MRPTSHLAVTCAGGGVYPERSRGTQQVADTVRIHTNTIVTARQIFQFGGTVSEA